MSAVSVSAYWAQRSDFNKPLSLVSLAEHTSVFPSKPSTFEKKSMVKAARILCAGKDKRLLKYLILRAYKNQLFSMRRKKKSFAFFLRRKDTSILCFGFTQKGYCYLFFCTRLLLCALYLFFCKG